MPKYWQHPSVRSGRWNSVELRILKKCQIPLHRCPLFSSITIAVTWGCMHRRVFIKKTWFSDFSYAQSHISLVFCRSLGFLVPWCSSLTAVPDLADFLCHVWRRMWVVFICLQKLYLTEMFEWLLSYIQLWYYFIKSIFLFSPCFII